MQNLQALSSAVLASSKKKNLHVERCHYFIFFLAAVSIFTPEQAAVIFAVLIGVIELVIFVFSLQANGKKVLGQNLLRANILSESFSLNQSLDLSYLKASVTDEELRKSPDYKVENYYSIDRNEDERYKLKKILSESCFWTRNLYDNKKDSARNFLIFYSCLFIAMVLVSFYFDFFDEKSSLTRLIILLLTCVPLKDKIIEYLRFRDGKEKLEKLDLKLETMGEEIGKLMIIWSDYCVITSHTPLIDDKIYDKNKDRLNSLWNERSEVEKNCA